MAVSGWQSSPYFWHKTDFIVVVLGIPFLAIVLDHRLGAGQAAAWSPTPTGRIEAVWSDDRPDLQPRSTAEDPDAGTLLEPGTEIHTGEDE